MDDDKQNTNENQSTDQKIQPENPVEESINPTPENPQTIFETIPEEASSKEAEAEKLQPEEISPQMVSPEEVAPPEQNSPSEMSEEPSFPPDNRGRYLIIGGAVFLFLIIFILIFRAILGGGGNKEVKLVYWGLWEDKEIVQPLIDQYESKHKNVKIDYQKMSPFEYREKLLARSKTGQGPDIFRFHNTWLPQIKDVAAPLPKEIISNDEFAKTFYPIAAKDLNIEGHYYGIPLTIDGLVLVYNDKLFKNAGISSAPVTWEDIIDDVAKLTVKNKDGQIVTSGIAMGTASNVDHFSDIFGLFLLQNGADIKKLNTPEASGALESYRKFAEPPNNFWDETLPNSTAAFIQEKVAMIIVPSWEILTIKATNPDLELKVVPVPTIPGSKLLSLASYWIEGVSKMSANQIEAWRFLKYLSEKENLTKLYELESKTRLFGEPYSRVDLKEELSTNEYLGAVIKQGDSFVSLPTVSRTYDNGLNDEINKYLENAINQTINGVSYEEAMITANLGITQVLSKYKVE